MTHVTCAAYHLFLLVVFPVLQKSLIAIPTFASLWLGSSVGGPGFHSFASLILVLITAGEHFVYTGREITSCI